MLKNVRGPITEHVLMSAHEKMPGGFADIAGNLPVQPTRRNLTLCILQTGSHLHAGWVS